MPNNRSTDLHNEAGGEFITDTATHNGAWKSVKCTDAGGCTFTTLTAPNWTPTDLSALTLASGDSFFGIVTTIKLATGKVLAAKQ